MISFIKGQTLATVDIKVWRSEAESKTLLEDRRSEEEKSRNSKGEKTQGEKQRGGEGRGNKIDREKSASR